MRINLTWMERNKRIHEMKRHPQLVRVRVRLVEVTLTLTLTIWLCLTYAGEDSTKESNEYYVPFCPYAISDIVSHTGEPTADVTICSTAVPKSSSHSINWPAASIASSSFFSLFQRASAAFFAFDVLFFLMAEEVDYTNYYVNVWSAVTKKTKFDLRSWVEGWNFTDTSIRTYKRDPSIISR